MPEFTANNGMDNSNWYWQYTILAGKIIEENHISYKDIVCKGV
jgi:hypothetical protein